MIQQALQLFGHVLDTVSRVVELGAGGVCVDPFVIHLCGRVGVSVSIPGHLPGPPYVVIADCLPPDAGGGLLKSLDPVIHLSDLHFSEVRCFRVAVPALHQVDYIEHGQEGHGDVDISIGAGAVMVEPGPVAVEVGGTVVVRSHDCDAIQGAPAQRAKAAVHEQGQEQALPVRLPTQRAAQGLLERTLLEEEIEKEE